MATTASILSTAAGAKIQIVVAIEGYDYLLTDGATSLVTTAWFGSGWTQALGGLFVQWQLKEDIKPWEASLNIGSVVLSVMDVDGVDRFGVDVHGGKAGTQTQTTATINAQDATIAVKAGNNVSSPVWIGPERITYTGHTGTQLTTCTRGTLAPFKAGSESAQRFGRNHSIPDVNNARQAQIPPVVSTKPRVWIGRRVGVWLHVSTDGGLNLNTKAEAQLLFAGRIASTRDASNGCTVVECVDIRQEILDCILLRDQYIGKVQEGVVLQTGQKFQAYDSVNAGATKRSVMTVVNTAPASSYEVKAGVYSSAELAALINQFFGQSKADGKLSFNWQFTAEYRNTNGDIRSHFTWAHTVAADNKFTGIDMPTQVMRFIGFTTNFRDFLPNSTDASWSADSDEEPYRILPVVTYGPNYLYVEHTGGAWIDNTAFLPQVVQPLSGSSWGILKLSTGDIALAQNVGTFAMTNGKTVDQFSVIGSPHLAGLGNSPIDSLLVKGVRASQGDVQIDIAQMAVLEGTFADLLTRFLLSTGVANYNDATYDTLTEQLGAGIPGELLGTTWINSVTAIDAASTARGLLVVLDKPTKLWDVFKTEMIARRAHLVWAGAGGSGNGGLEMVTWSTPTATTAVWNFTEANKAVAAGTKDPQRVPTEITDEFAVPMIKLSYNRMPDGKYRDTLTVIDRNALDDAGNASRVLTLEMRNSYGGFVATGQTVEQLAADMVTWLPLLSRPLRRLRRTLGIEHLCTLAAADQCTVNDNFARDPSTGVRGLVARPGLILGYSKNLGGPSPDPGAGPRPLTNEADILLLPTDRIATYAPCAELDAGASGAGYNAGAKTLTCLAHAHSLSSEPADASRFATNDLCRLVEIDPDAPASPLTWTFTVASVAGNVITMTAALAAPAFDTAKKYRVIYDHYAADTATQKAHVFQGDATTNLIESVQDAFQYGYMASNSPIAWPAENPANPVAMYSTRDYGDGVPLHPGHERDAVRLINNLLNYRCAVLNPVLRATAMAYTSPGGTFIRAMLCTFPKFVGLGVYPGNLTRLLTLAPFASNSHASPQTLTVTLSRFYPVGASMVLTSLTNPEYQFIGPYVQQSAVLAAKTFDTRVCDQLDDGKGYITVEVTGAITAGIQFYGFSDVHVGALA